MFYQINSNITVYYLNILLLLNCSLEVYANDINYQQIIRNGYPTYMTVMESNESVTKLLDNYQMYHAKKNYNYLHEQMKKRISNLDKTELSHARKNEIILTLTEYFSKMNQMFTIRFERHSMGCLGLFELDTTKSFDEHLFINALVNRKGIHQIGSFHTIIANKNNTTTNVIDIISNDLGFFKINPPHHQSKQTEFIPFYPKSTKYHSISGHNKKSIYSLNMNMSKDNSHLVINYYLKEMKERRWCTTFNSKSYITFKKKNKECSIQVINDNDLTITMIYYREII